MTLWFLQQAAPEAPVEVQSSDSSDTASTSDTASVNSKDSEDSEDSDDDDETEESVSKNMPITHLAIYCYFMVQIKTVASHFCIEGDCIAWAGPYILYAYISLPSLRPSFWQLTSVSPGNRGGG